MASYDQPNLLARYKAAVDLSAKQYTFVKPTADDEVDTSGVGALHNGILMNKPVAGINAEIAGLGGGALLKLAGAVTRGTEIKADASGEGVAATGAGDVVGAVALETGADNDIIPVQVVIYRKHA